jgi:thioester reductase-like protein
MSSNLIYQLPSLNQLAKHIYYTLHPALESQKLVIDWKNMSEDMFAKYSDHHFMHETHKKLTMVVNQNDSKSTVSSITSKSTLTETGSIYLLTGATGSLGNFLLQQLLQKPETEVKRVYCMIRAPTSTHREVHSSNTELDTTNWGLNKLCRSFQQRELDGKFLAKCQTDNRLKVFQCKLEDEEYQLGLTPNQYREIAMNVTHIIHVAWKMDFNAMITEFEASCIRPTFALLQLSALGKQKQFTFISSISSCLEYPTVPVPEEIHHNVLWSHHMGYGQSKLVGERLAETFKQKYGLKSAIQVIRVGQIMGDSQKGIWNTAEHFPLLINAGQAMRKLPNHYFGDIVDWVPVDYCAQAIIELTEWLNNYSTYQVPVAHLVNPHPIQYDQMLKYTGLDCERVGAEEWMKSLKLLDPEKVPAVKLAHFFEESFKSQQKIIFSTDNTVKRSRTMHSCPEIQRSWIEASMEDWKRIGFLHA